MEEPIEGSSTFFVGRLTRSNDTGTNLRPWQGRSAGVTFCRQKVTKDRQRRGLPPPCGIHPAVLGVPAFSLFRPLAWWGHIDGLPFYGLDLLLCSYVLLLPGPYPGKQQFPVAGGLAPGGGNAASPG